MGRISPYQQARNDIYRDMKIKKGRDSERVIIARTVANTRPESWCSSVFECALARLVRSPPPLKAGNRWKDFDPVTAAVPDAEAVSLAVGGEFICDRSASGQLNGRR